MKKMLFLAILVAQPVAAQENPIHVELKGDPGPGGLRGLLGGGKRDRNMSALCQTVKGVTSCETQKQIGVRNWYSIFNMERHRSKRLGKLIAMQDCPGAHRYALSKGDFNLIHNVTKICGAYDPYAPIEARSPITSKERKDSFRQGELEIEAALQQAKRLQVK